MAIHICVLTAFSLVPKNTLMRKWALSTRSNSALIGIADDHSKKAAFGRLFVVRPVGSGVDPTSDFPAV